jgi:tetratricopeptide (TPR) repeat protein
VSDSDAAKLEKLEALLGPQVNETAGRTMRLMAELLSLPTEGFPPLDLSPPQRKVATITALLDLLIRLADVAPVLVVLEDAHWCDPTTLDLWTRLIVRIGSSRVLVLVTARPEFVSPWGQISLVGSMELVSLTASQSAELVAEIAAPQSLGPELVDDIVGKADGVPLYVEELTKAVLESSTLERSSVPATLHDSLMARLDRLGPAKEIAQIAAVIGQQFSLALLAAVTPYTTAELEMAIAPLVEAGLAFRQSRSTEPTYSFRHALLRDVAYENLLRARRQQLHDNIARALESKFAAVATAEPELLAHHFHHAGLFNLAADYRERAGARALSRSAFAEAVAHFTAALAEVEKLPEARDQPPRQLALLLALGPPLSIIKGAQSREVEEVYRRAHGNATLLNNGEGLFKATWGLWYNANIGRRLDNARDHAEALMKLGRNFADDDFLLEAFHCRWSTAQFRGEIPMALQASQEGIDRYDQARHSWMGPVFGGHDPGVCAHGVKALTLAMQGRNGAARSAVDEAVALAEALKHPNTRAHSLLAAMTTAQILGDFAAVTDYAQRALALADKYDLLPVRSHATFISGAALALGSDLDAGMAVMEREFQRASTVGPYMRFYSALLAEGRKKCGRVPDALALLRSALATVTEPGVGLFVPELYRLQGLCLLDMDGASEGEAMRSLKAAVDIARQQQATLLELRAAVGRARASIAMGQPAEGLAALQNLVRSLPVEFDPDNLIEARNLLTAARGVTL